MKQFNNLTLKQSRLSRDASGQAINKSFTLVEVLIFVTLISLIFITVSYTVTISLKNTKINEHKILATHYAEELKEWLRGEKEDDWNSFTATKMGTWCFKEKLISWNQHTACSPSDLIDELFKREVSLAVNGTQITVNITVEWKEDNNTYKIPINTVFSIWE